MIIYYRCFVYSPLFYSSSVFSKSPRITYVILVVCNHLLLRLTVSNFLILQFLNVCRLCIVNVSNVFIRIVYDFQQNNIKYLYVMFFIIFLYIFNINNDYITVKTDFFYSTLRWILKVKLSETLLLLYFVI